MPSQGYLAPVFHFEERGNDIRELLNRAIVANGLSIETLAHDTGIDSKQIGRALRNGGGAHPPFALIAAVMDKDQLGIFLRGLCSLAGYEATPKIPDPAGENAMLREELARIQGEISRLLGRTP